VAQLAAEVRDKGWIVYDAYTKNGDWDLFLMRPDGSQRRNITNTPRFTEAAPRFSPDGKKMLYRRLPKGALISHDVWGFQGELVIANANGSDPVAVGGKGEYPWGAWSPDGKQISCLSKKGIMIVDLATKQVIRTMPRKGFYQQLFWSPDGLWFCGVANHLGKDWTVARMNVQTGEVNAVNTGGGGNCTPDWFPDSKQVIFSYDPPGQKGYGWTQLWMADGDGKNSSLVYGQERRHIYGGALSPDGKYVLFSASVVDGGLSEWKGAPMGLMRLADAPIVGGDSPTMRKLHPNAKDGPVVPLGDGWEPHWTFAEVLPASAGK
jgi:Tol biopolymer transport system component